MIVESIKAQPWNPDRPQLPSGHRLLKGHLEFQTATEAKKRKAQRTKAPLDLVQKPCHPSYQIASSASAASLGRARDGLAMWRVIRGGIRMPPPASSQVERERGLCDQIRPL